MKNTFDKLTKSTAQSVTRRVALGPLGLGVVRTVVCVALLLGLLASDTMAAKTPPASPLWPAGANLDAQFVRGQILPYSIHVNWPIANGADHYRLTVIDKTGGAVDWDSSPATFNIVAGRASAVVPLKVRNGVVGRTYLVTVTAYSAPNEAVAHAESLQATVKTLNP